MGLLVENKIIQVLHKNCLYMHGRCAIPEVHWYDAYVYHSRFTPHPSPSRRAQKALSSLRHYEELCGFILWRTDMMMGNVVLESQWEK